MRCGRLSVRDALGWEPEQAVNAARWVLLIYSLPATPSRKRAFVWRELKKLGAVYLRDGVAVLPAGAQALAAFRTIAVRVEDFEGQATVVDSAELDRARVNEIVAESRAARASEYADILNEAQQLWDYMQRESSHRDFTPVELDQLTSDLNKLRRWREQVAARDYFASGAHERLRDVLSQFEAALTNIRSSASPGTVAAR